jgi:predicted DNA-binding transcriptional regulator AlpA
MEDVTSIAITHAQPTVPGRYFMRRGEVTARVGLKSEAIRLRERAGTFPKRIFLSPQTAVWDSVSVFAWLDHMAEYGPRDHAQATLQ